MYSLTAYYFYGRNALIKEYTKKGSKCKRHCPIKTTTTATQATTNKPSTSSEFSASYSSESVESQPQSDATTTSASYSSESVESQPQSDATTTSSPVTTTDLTLIRRKKTP